jgi:hypothetical protein
VSPSWSLWMNASSSMPGGGAGRRGGGGGVRGQGVVCVEGAGEGGAHVHGGGWGGGEGRGEHAVVVGGVDGGGAVLIWCPNQQQTDLVRNAGGIQLLISSPADLRPLQCKVMQKHMPSS